ncbi:MAG: FAD-dependent oxidoreductase [Acidimicrobiia bacterium]|nr:FAD-dependent oxidoreductase [Acidimicrobiia bacterium]
MAASSSFRATGLTRPEHRQRWWTRHWVGSPAVARARTVDVVVVGGGVVGVATAWFCARAGMSVRLLEREGLAAGASGRNQGLVIGPHPAPMAPLAARGLQHYLALHEDSGGAFALDLEDHGCLLLGAEPGAVEGTVLSGGALRAAEPLLGPGTDRAVLMPARRIDPRGMVAAMAEAARAAGAELCTGCEVKDLVVSGDRVLGVRADDGEHHAGVTVVAAGPWSWRVARRLPFDVPVQGVRGWIAVTRPAPFRLRHAIEDSGWAAAKTGLRPPTVGDLAGGTVPAPLVAGLLQQDHRGRVLLGASLQVATGDHAEGAGALAGVARRAAALVPALAELAVVETRTCKRPMSADGLPLHGPVPGTEGVVLACGHGSTGITWGAGSGEAVAGGIAEGRWDPALLPGRFGVDGGMGSTGPPPGLDDRPGARG